MEPKFLPGTLQATFPRCQGDGNSRDIRSLSRRNTSHAKPEQKGHGLISRACGEPCVEQVPQLARKMQSSGAWVELQKGAWGNLVSQSQKTGGKAAGHLAQQGQGERNVGCYCGEGQSRATRPEFTGEVSHSTSLFTLWES